MNIDMADSPFQWHSFNVKWVKWVNILLCFFKNVSCMRVWLCCKWVCWCPSHKIDLWFQVSDRICLSSSKNKIWFWNITWHQLNYVQYKIITCKLCNHPPPPLLYFITLIISLNCLFWLIEIMYHICRRRMPSMILSINWRRPGSFRLQFR